MESIFKYSLARPIISYSSDQVPKLQVLAIIRFVNKVCVLDLVQLEDDLEVQYYF